MEFDFIDFVENTTHERYEGLQYAEDLRQEMFGGESPRGEDETFLKDKFNVKIECVESYGGEGMGDDYYAVHKVTEGDEVRYYKMQGWYASHYGSEYQDTQEVKPKEVTVTQYVSV